MTCKSCRAGGRTGEPCECPKCASCGTYIPDSEDGPYEAPNGKLYCENCSRCTLCRERSMPLVDLTDNTGRVVDRACAVCARDPEETAAEAEEEHIMTFAEAYAELAKIAAARGETALALSVDAESMAGPEAAPTLVWCAYLPSTGHIPGGAERINNPARTAEECVARMRAEIERRERAPVPADLSTIDPEALAKERAA